MKKIYILFFGLLAGGIHASAQTFTPLDVSRGAADGNPYGMTTYNGKVYFNAKDSVNGYELFTSDGTQAGTSILKDIYPGTSGSTAGVSATTAVVNIIEVNGKLLFTADDGTSGHELWVTDGTTAGTVLLLDINPGGSTSNISNLTRFNNKVYFTANDGAHGYELWVTDGTAVGTSMLKDINPGIGDSRPYGSGGTEEFYSDGYTEYNGKLYFQASDGVHGTELWSTDGTSLGTTMVADIYPGALGSSPQSIKIYNNKLLINAEDSAHGTELWLSDGTASGTVLLKDINPGFDGSNPGRYTSFKIYNGKAYFGAYTDAEGYELWMTDGTSLGTTVLKNISPNDNSSNAGQGGFLIYGNRLFFAANDSVNGAQLWTSDGTAAGTALFKIMAVGANGSPRDFYIYHGEMFFQGAMDATSGYQLWASDGTPGGTRVIAPAIAPNVNPLVYNYGYRAYAELNGSLLFCANFNNIGAELWAYNTVATAISETAGDHALSVYPNPFSNTITLTELRSEENYTVRMIDMTGRECYTITLDHASTTTQITIPELSTGIYLMEVASAGRMETFRIVKN